MIQNLTDNNKVVIIGEIIKECELSHELYGEKFYEFQVKVNRLSGTTDDLLIVVSERLINKDNLILGTLIEVNGQFRSYNNQQSGNKLKLVIFAREISVLTEISTENNHNSIYLNGFICKPPVYRTTPLGREICDIILAVNRSYYKSDYIPIITWGRNAKFSKKLNIGDNIKIWGRIQSRLYDKKLPNGETVGKTVYEISVSKMEVSGENNNQKNEDEK